MTFLLLGNFLIPIIIVILVNVNRLNYLNHPIENCTAYLVFNCQKC